MIVDKTMGADNGYKTSHLLSPAYECNLQYLQAVHVMCKSLLHFVFFIISASGEIGTCWIL